MKKNRKNEIVPVRFTEGEKKAMKDKAKKEGLTLSKLIRRAVLSLLS